MWAPFPERGTLQRRWDTEAAAGSSKRVGVALPALFVEIDGKEPAGFIA